MFGKKVKVAPFSERMANIKSMFKIAHENASNLHTEMEEEIAKKKSQIATLQEDIKTIDATKQEAIIEQFSNSIDEVKNSKKGVANAAKNLITELINNPVLPYEEGEERVLRGYKIQFESRDGRYNCVDMDITRTEKESGIRPVNINTISYLIFDGIKYIVE